MNKTLILLLLAVVIAALWTFDSSFYTLSPDSLGTMNASGTSAVIVAKANYISLRAKFFISAEPGHTALVVFPDGTQKNVTTSYSFEVFLPKSGSFPGSYDTGTPIESVVLSDRKPIDAAVVSNVTEDFFRDVLTPDPSGTVALYTLYWFKIQGNAFVIVSGYGVAV